MCSDFSNEISVDLDQATGKTSETRLVANFTSGSTVGVAPLVVTFSDQSSGNVTSRTWDFGDGGTSAGATAVHTYQSPGVYNVKLTVGDGNGTVSETKSGYITVVAVKSSGTPGAASGAGSAADTQTGSGTTGGFPIEIGDMEIDSTWKRIDFQQRLSDPIVVASGLSYAGGDPAVIRIRGVDSTGFWARVEEWNYRDGWHTVEHASYIAMERGQYELPGGILVEAGSLSTDATGVFEFQPLSAGFSEPPVVFTSVNSENGGDTVTTRLRTVTANGFFVGMWEQESNSQWHTSERIDYIAWQASSGEVDGLRFEVGLASSGVTQNVYSLAHASDLGDSPVLLMGMQTSNGGDPCAIRWAKATTSSVQTWIQEEQSKDAEVQHVGETLGYFAADVVN